MSKCNVVSYDIRVDCVEHKVSPFAISSIRFSASNSDKFVWCVVVTAWSRPASGFSFSFSFLKPFHQYDHVIHYYFCAVICWLQVVSNLLLFAILRNYGPGGGGCMLSHLRWARHDQSIACAACHRLLVISIFVYRIPNTMPLSMKEEMCRWEREPHRTFACFGVFFENSGMMNTSFLILIANIFDYFIAVSTCAIKRETQGFRRETKKFLVKCHGNVISIGVRWNCMNWLPSRE